MEIPIYCELLLEINSSSLTQPTFLVLRISYVTTIRCKKLTQLALNNDAVCLAQMNSLFIM